MTLSPSEMRLAGIGRRSVAALLDGLPFAALFWWASPLLPIAPLLFVAYHTLAVGNTSRTPGKWVAGVAVLHPDGSALTIEQALGRAAAAMLGGIPLFAGWWVAAFDSERRALHDRMAESRAYRVR